MKLYYSPGACSLGIHVLLEEIGKPYDVELINVRDGAQFSEAFTAVSQKAKVPALGRDDGSILTEYGAIATWLARTNPAAKLMPADADAEARAVEAMDYVVATVHMQGFTRIARPANFSPNEADKEQVQDPRPRNLRQRPVDPGPGAGGPGVDRRGLFRRRLGLVLRVATGRLRAEVTLPSNVAAHFGSMKARPAVQRAMAAEGLTG